MYARLALAICAVLIACNPIQAQVPYDIPQDSEGPIPYQQNTSAEWFWAKVDYLGGWIEGPTLPDLVTTSPTGTAEAQAGVLGRATTQTLFGGEIDDGYRSGFRLQGGWWLLPDSPIAVEAGLTWLGSHSEGFSTTSDRNRIIARPFNNAVTNTPQAVLIAYPGKSKGAVSARATSGEFHELHCDFTDAFYDDGRLRFTGLLGYRYYRYDDGLNVLQLIAPTDPNFTPGTLIASADYFDAQNRFHGLDLGLRAEVFWDNLSLELLAKVAVGRVFREVNIQGNQVVTAPGATTVIRNGGVFALTSNIGKFTSHDWNGFPEFGATISYQICSQLRLRAGYSLLLIDGAARAGDQIDLTLDPNLLPPAGAPGTTPARPAFSLHHTNIWVQYFNFGAEFVF